MYKRTKIRMAADFSLGKIQARRHWSNILKALKKKNLKFYAQQNYVSKKEGIIKILSELKQLERFITHSLFL